MADRDDRVRISDGEMDSVRAEMEYCQTGTDLIADLLDARTENTALRDALRGWLEAENALPDQYLHPALTIRTMRLLGFPETLEDTDD
jgi:hypothetical protein